MCVVDRRFLGYGKRSSVFLYFYWVEDKEEDIPGMHYMVTTQR